MGDNSAESEYCKVNITKVNKDVEGKVELQVFSSKNEFNLKLHKKFDDIEVTLGDDNQKLLKESENTTIHCIVKGGFPTPKLTFMLMENNDTVVNNSESRFVNITTTPTDDSITLSSSFTPSKTDQGLYVCCHAEQSDEKMDRSLYKENKVK